MASSPEVQPVEMTAAGPWAPKRHARVMRADWDQSIRTSRWTLDELRSKLSSVLLETTRAASGGIASRMSG